MPPPTTLLLFNVLDIVSILLTLLVLFPATFSKSVQRMNSWFGLLVSGLVNSFSLLLLVGHQSRHDPPPSLCAMSAGLIYAGPPLYDQVSCI